MRYEKIRNLREDNDLNQTQLATILNIAQTNYSNYENGNREIPISILIQFPKFYNSSLDYLLELTKKFQILS